ncbi:hypothetical protein SSS_10518 [Sarcoptes scabiei]|uniref:Uncharacterized protein n=1 Tax=Sarcoptes scabiei TaxID=52283 RepID=A0A834VA06_SARSC|nr:hypothetical protein SSS_10518 [Sarcoptes scabiei]
MSDSKTIDDGMRKLIKILEKWTKLVDEQSIKLFLIPTETNASENDDWFVEKLSLIDVLSNEIEDILSKYNDIIDIDMKLEETNEILSQCFSCRRTIVERLETFLKCFRINITKLREFSLSVIDSVGKRYEDLYYAKIRKQMVLRLSLIYLHTSTVVGLVKLIENDNFQKKIFSNDQEPTLPSSLSQINQSNLNSIDLLLSTNEESLIRLSICHSLCIAFIMVILNYLPDSLCRKTLMKIFPTSAHLPNLNEKFNFSQDPSLFQSYELMKPIYLIYLQLFLLNSSSEHRLPPIEIIQQTIRNDCLGIILLLFSIYKIYKKNDYEKKELSFSSMKNQSFLIVENEFAESHFKIPNRLFIIRNLLLLLSVLRSPEANSSRALLETIVNLLRNHLIHDGGLSLLVDAALDSDETSQKETTIIQRLQAMTTLIIHLPVKQKEKYIERIIDQTIKHLLLQNDTVSKSMHKQNIYWHFGTMILNDLNKSHKETVKKLVFNELHKSFRNETSLSIKDSIDIIERFAIHRTCLKQCSSFFAILFYLRLQFELKPTIIDIKVKQQCERLLILILKEISNSVYIFDQCICDQKSEFIDRFQIDYMENGDCLIKFKTFEEKQEDFSELDIQIINYSLKILDQMSINFRFDLFYLLLERFLDENPSIIVATLIENLCEKLFGSTITKEQEDYRENIINSNPRAIQFLCSTFERMANRLTQSEAYTDLEKEFWEETIMNCHKYYRFWSRISRTPFGLRQLNLKTSITQIFRAF